METIIGLFVIREIVRARCDKIEFLANIHVLNLVYQKLKPPGKRFICNFYQMIYNGGQIMHVKESRTPSSKTTHRLILCC